MSQYHQRTIWWPKCGETGLPVEGPLLFSFFFFFANTQKVTDIDCVQSDIEQQQKQKVRVKWRERGETAELHANVQS